MKARKFAFVACGIAAALGGAIPFGYALGFRINYTHSAPSGLYQVKKNDELKRGQLVEVCPPDQAVIHLMGQRGYLMRGLWGNCEGTNITPLLKPVSAVPGDTVTLEPGKPVKVNGTALPNTEAMPAVPAFPAGSYRVQAGELWVFSSYSRGSVDSRYFGPVRISNVVGQAKPIFIKGDISKTYLGVVRQ